MAATTKPPTGLLGHVDQDSQWTTILADWSETISDLYWPTSVWTYNQMRRDPRLTAILNSYTLLLRRATWHVNPAGCRDEVVQLVADDLGLPILGDDQPGPARVRGVSWPQHLRMALLDLVFGHMGFEMLAELRGGQARLVALAERMPASISQIHITSDGQGAFNGISQWSLPGSRAATPDIPASRMVWYTHEREGTQWQGHSLLRSAYAPWLLKREMQRVNATSHRRFGMGVPVVEWAPGVTPTPAQHQAALQVAAAARVGDQSGAAMPPGAFLRLVGLSGSVPDTQAFLDWLNSEMAIATLTQFLDLGNSQSGSRALGEAFVDFFLLAVEALGDETADTTTRQIGARIVDWNWGPDEPVPAVEVVDIGARPELTAEAINQLMLAGAITPDPELEATVRSRYGLPQRTTPQPVPAAPQPPTPGPAPAAGAAQPVDRTAAILQYVRDRPAGVRAAEVEQQFGTDARRTLARLCNAGRLGRAARGVYVPKASDGTSGQLSRDPSPEEQAAGVDFAGHQQAHDDALADLIAQWPALAAAIRDQLAADAATAATLGGLAALGGLTASSAALAAALAAALGALAGTAAAAVVAEAAYQGVTVAAPDTAALPAVEAQAQVTAQAIAGVLAGQASTAALQAGADADGEAVAAAVTAALTPAVDTAPAWVSDRLSQALNVGQAAGRGAAMEAAPAAASYYASEVLDKNTCNPCYDVDGKLFADLAAAQAEYAFGGYRYCDGGLRCRGMIIARWEAS